MKLAKKHMKLKSKLKDTPVKELYTMYDTCLQEEYTEDKQQIVKKRVIEEIVDETKIVTDTSQYNSYPSYQNPNFMFELSKKAEFFHHKITMNPTELEGSCDSTKFELGHHQQFLQNFIHEKTPYRGLLLFHGVGVGKTCSAISISQSFRDIYKRTQKKIICLVSKNIRPGWKRTIYDPEKGPNQCTGTTYKHIVKSLEKTGFLYQKGMSRKINKMISQYYEFYGYREFSGMIQKLVDKGGGEQNRQEVLHNYFSNRLLLIDEVHNLRDEKISGEKQSDDTKETLKNIDDIITYSHNLRLILLSATPMFNRSTEIVSLLNMLLKNDKRPPLRFNKRMFTENDDLTEEGTKILYQKSRGYISYLRGENPITFPVRLYPDSNEDPLCLVDNYPENNMFGVPLEGYNIKFLKLYNSTMKNQQKQIYNAFIKSLSKNEELTMDNHGVGVQISNVVFSSSKKNASKMYGKQGFERVFVEKDKRSFSYRPEYLQDNPIPLFDSSMLQHYSSKIDSIIQNIKKTKGIIFIYSQYIYAGILPLAFALEHAGYGKLSRNLLHYSEWKPNSKKHTKQEPVSHNGKGISKKGNDSFKQAKYIILSGNKDLSPNNIDEIKTLMSSENSEGEQIKIVLGTRVASEGLDFKNIREIHILDPWFHLSRIEQIIGRGIRYCSHNQLPDKKEHNVTVYLHTASVSEVNESVDIRAYRMAEEKSYQIGKIETILKSNAVDYYLNKSMNYIQEGDIPSVSLTTSLGTPIQDFKVHDKPFSKICSFQDECDYKNPLDTSTNNELLSLKYEDINYDTFSMNHSKGLLRKVQSFITDMFVENSYYSLEQITDKLLQLIDTNQTIIYYSIHDMIKTKQKVWNSKKEPGYIVHNNKYYIFQPLYNHDERLPLYYRLQAPPDTMYKMIPLSKQTPKYSKKKTITPTQSVESYSSVIEKLLENITKDTITIQKKEYDVYPILSLSTETIRNYMIDKLSLEDKRVLLQEIVMKKMKEESLDTLDKDILTFFEMNMIYTDNVLSPKDYQLAGKYKKATHIYGFFLVNPDAYHKLQNNPENIKDVFDFFMYDIFNNIHILYSCLTYSSQNHLPKQRKFKDF